MKNRSTPEKALRLRKRVYLAILILLVFATFSYFFSDVSRTESHVEGTNLKAFRTRGTFRGDSAF